MRKKHREMQRVYKYTPTRIYVEEDDKLLGTFPIGNLKLHRILTLNLPTIYTCPGALDCIRWCYGTRPENRFPRTLRSRQRNLEMTKRQDFSDILKVVISIAKNFKVTIVRPHEAGDFYNQEYLNTWLTVMKLNQEMKFYAYTRSAHLDFTTKPKNFNLLYSTGGKYDSMIPDGSRVCTTFENKPPIGFEVCPCRKGHPASMCGLFCFACPSGNKNIAIKKH
jgi:hypothetical protein